MDPGPLPVFSANNPNVDPNVSTRPGYVIDDGPRNEAPGDADRGVSRRGAGRHDRNVLVPQPGCPAAGGGGSDPGRDRPRSGGQGEYRRLSFSGELCLVS